MPQTWIGRAGMALSVVLLLAAMGMAGWWYSSQPGDRLQAVDTGGQVPIGGPFQLVDQDGQTVTEADFSDRYMLIYFGFTYCPDVCPAALWEMTQALDMLEEADPDKAEKVVPIFITVDPERDDVAAMKSYVSHFHPRMLGLTGTTEQVAQAAREYRAYYKRVDDASASTYLMDHSSFIYFMNPAGDFVTSFTHQTPPEEMFSELEKLVKG
ncbi:SCO family protein [Algihabitans albus]|uniref:SCO family protein n=1 Tax=Algihabitans albus TaxID=2164067 RepID=UPI001F172A38|nr:SCO family protein [Algihabitans albus]